MSGWGWVALGMLGTPLAVVCAAMVAYSVNVLRSAGGEE